MKQPSQLFGGVANGSDQVSRDYDPDIGDLITELESLRQQMLDLEASFAVELDHIHPLHQASARNVLHYVALRRNDIRDLQTALVNRGLSSLGRCESYVMANLHAVLVHLRRFQGDFSTPFSGEVLSYDKGQSRIAENTQRMFGASPPGRAAHIMVTMPTEAATNSDLVEDLVRSGMGCMRINCAHDNPRTWAAMIRNLRQAEERVGRPCKIVMDLAGPKLRTGPMQAGPEVLKWRPQRDSYGRVVIPARIWFHHENQPGSAPPSARYVIPVHGELIDHTTVGETIYLRDARAKNRRLKVIYRNEHGILVESLRTAYVTPGTELHSGGSSIKRSGKIRRTSVVGSLPALDRSIRLQAGDRMIVTGDLNPGEPAVVNEEQHVVAPAHIGLTLPEILQDVKVGDRILFDDGKMAGVIQEVLGHQLVVEINQVLDGTGRLRGDKGINLPDSSLALDALTPKDIQDLEFIVQHADIVAYSFVRRECDVHRLQAELARLGRPDMGIILKIENRQAFQQLPQLLLAVMRSPVCGVMIARGDLAVECGYERLAELQEEILWMCEAAHIPVVWATQVLETLAKRGQPSRAEVTDAAMGVRAECVMLNKGPHIVAAVRTLVDILIRMQDHQLKKRPMLRRLRLADDWRQSGSSDDSL